VYVINHAFDLDRRRSLLCDAAALGVAAHGGYAIRTFPYAVVHAIDIDRDVVELGGRYFGLSPNPRLHIHLQDGRQWPERSKDAFDLIMLESPA
jgi:hypothetical protein